MWLVPRAIEATASLLGLTIVTLVAVMHFCGADTYF